MSEQTNKAVQQALEGMETAGYAIGLALPALCAHDWTNPDLCAASIKQTGQLYERLSNMGKAHPKFAYAASVINGLVAGLSEARPKR